MVLETKKCEICGDEAEVKPFTQTTGKGLVRKLACAYCIAQLT